MITWRDSKNAANFAMEVTRLTVDRSRFHYAIPATAHQLLVEYLDAVTTIAAAGVFSYMCADRPMDGFTQAQDEAAFAAWQAFVTGPHARFRAWDDEQHTQVTAALANLARDVTSLMNPTRSPKSVAQTTTRWVYTWATNTERITRAEIETIEIRHRLIDAGKVTEAQRLAFEAAWIAGHHKLASQILRRANHPATRRKITP